MPTSRRDLIRLFRHLGSFYAHNAAPALAMPVRKAGLKSPETRTGSRSTPSNGRPSQTVAPLPLEEGRAGDSQQFDCLVRVSAGLFHDLQNMVARYVSKQLGQ